VRDAARFQSPIVLGWPMGTKEEEAIAVQANVEEAVRVERLFVCRQRDFIPPLSRLLMPSIHPTPPIK